jgi:hypothetical protein
MGEEMMERNAEVGERGREMEIWMVVLVRVCGKESFRFEDRVQQA